MATGQQITLFDLNQTIRNKLVEAFPESLWVIAEISEIKVGTTGHCYLDLIQKEDRSNSLKAKASATIWASTFRMLRPYFEMTTGRALSSGMKILIRATVEYHELYGLSLKVLDIDPTYTVGEMELQRQQTIQKLVDEGVFEMNKQVDFPLAPLRVAVISSEQAAGYQDFMHQLTANDFGFAFQTVTFNATMQGKDAEPSILRALESIFDSVADFDTVVIIRGGGAQADLSCFDSYWLAFHIAQFPLPIITGIGHTKDISVCDMVSNTSVKTPTAAAELLISKVAEFDAMLTEFATSITETVENYIEKRQVELKQASRKVLEIKAMLTQQGKALAYFAFNLKTQTDKNIKQNDWILTTAYKSVVSHPHVMINREKTSINRYKIILKHSIHASTTSESRVLDAKESIFRNLHPNNILKRGYSITRINGKSVTSSEQLYPGQLIETTLANGTLHSKIVPTEITDEPVLKNK